MTGRTKVVLAALAGSLVGGLLTAGAAVAVVYQTFSDVPPSSPFFDEIEWAAANGIAEGYPDDTFRPGSNVTRQASVAFLARYNDGVELRIGASVEVVGSGGGASATCPPGKRAISGGGFTTSGLLHMTDSFPINAVSQVAWIPSNATGWKVLWGTNGDSVLVSPATLNVWVLCAPAKANP